MAVKRSGPAAAPLGDGRVLVAGGYDGASVLPSADLFALAPRGPFVFTLRRKTLIFTARVAGMVTVRDTKARSGAARATAKKRKRRPALRPSTASGDAGEISVQLRLTRKAKRRLKSTGRAKLQAEIAFAPTGQCAAVIFKSCYDAGTETATLKIKQRRRRK